MQLNKIIITGYELSGLGGMETVCSKLVTLLKARNPDLDISFVFFKEGSRKVSDEWLKNCRHYRVTSKIKNTKIRRLSFANSLRKIIHRERPDLILAIDTLSCFISKLARQYTWRKPVIFSWLHFSTHNLYKAKYVQCADYHLSICSAITEQLTNMGINKNRIFTVHNPVQRSHMLIPRPTKGARFIYVERVIADGQKNVRGLFEGLAKVQGEWVLDIIGTGEDTDLLKAFAQDLGISGRINWHGWRKEPWHFIHDVLQNVSCLLMTSHFEGFGMVLAEASSHGVYSISSDCLVGPADIIKENINGNLYPVDKPEHLVSLIQAIVEGKELPDGETIQHTIEAFYEDNYILKIIQAFGCAGFDLSPDQSAARLS
ncbi:glycosyltransferase [Cronobacter malonaticus]